MHIPDRLIPQSEISGRIAWVPLEITIPGPRPQRFFLLFWGSPGIDFKNLLITLLCSEFKEYHISQSSLLELV